MDNKQSPGARVAALIVVVAIIAATTVWLFTRGEANDASATSATGTSDSGSAAPEASSRRVSPDTSPQGGVVLPDGAEQDHGLPVELPYTDLGAVAAHAAVTRAQIGFDYDTATTAVQTYADPADAMVFEARASQAVQERRRAVGAPARGRVAPPASYAATPIAYSLLELDTDYYAVTLLSHITLTTVNAEVKDGFYGGTGLVKWVDGDWRLVEGSAADVQDVIDNGLPQPAAPGTPEFDEQDWIQLNERTP